MHCFQILILSVVEHHLKFSAPHQHITVLHLPALSNLLLPCSLLHLCHVLVPLELFLNGLIPSQLFIDGDVQCAHSDSQIAQAELTVRQL
jgi:hypothetical protein